MTRIGWRWLAGVAVAIVLMPTLASTALMQGEPAPRASDGHSLSDQSAETQASFIAVWGDQAGARWVAEHNAELARIAAQSPPTEVPTFTVIQPPPTLAQPPAGTTAGVTAVATAGATAVATAVATEPTRPIEAIETAVAAATPILPLPSLPPLPPLPGLTSQPTPTQFGGSPGGALPTTIPIGRTPGTIPTAAQPTPTVRR